MTRRSTLTPFSEIEAKPAPTCALCGQAMHYMGGTLKREDAIAGYACPGWRCPECGDLAAGPLDLVLSVRPRVKWRRVDADFFPQLHGRSWHYPGACAVVEIRRGVE